jgi:hypothetical protein
MRLVLRWGVAVVVSAAAFVLSWWVCQKLIGVDEGAALAIAGVVLVVVVGVAGWWAAHGPGDGKPDAAGRQSVQVRGDFNIAGRDVNIASRDVTIADRDKGAAPARGWDEGDTPGG